MNKSVLIIDMPELSDEAIALIQEFLQDLATSFESQHIIPIRRYYRRLYNEGKREEEKK